MKINIKQEGGFIGMASKAKLDYTKLTEEEQKTLDSVALHAAELMEAKTAARVRSLEAPMDAAAAKAPLLRSVSPARDTFCYSLSMKKDGKKLEVEFDDTNAPPELIVLFQKYIKL